MRLSSPQTILAVKPPGTTGGAAPFFGLPDPMEARVGEAGAARVADVIALHYDRFAHPLRLNVGRLWHDVRACSVARVKSSSRRASQTGWSSASSFAEQNHGDLLAIQAASLTLEDDTVNAQAAAGQARGHGASANYIRLADLILRYCAWKAGADLAPTTASTHHAASIAQACDQRGRSSEAMIDVLDLTLAASIEFSKLQIVSAQQLAQFALLRARAAPGSAAHPAALLARILYERGDHLGAGAIVSEHLRVIRSCGHLDSVMHAYVVRIRLAARNDSWADAAALVEEATVLAEERNWPRLLAAMLLENILLCGPGDHRSAAALLVRLRNLADHNMPTVRCARSEIRSQLARAELHCFIKFGVGLPWGALEHLRRDAWLSHNLHDRAAVILFEAKVLWIEGDKIGSMERLASSFRVVAMTGLKQQLAEAGDILSAMMDCYLEGRIIDRNVMVPAIFSIATEALPMSELFACPQRERHDASRSHEKLTTREREVLRLIGEGGTNKHIARVHGVAPETVKTHIRNIFTKLGVKRRAQAVALAQREGLLEPAERLSKKIGN